MVKENHQQFNQTKINFLKGKEKDVLSVASKKSDPGTKVPDDANEWGPADGSEDQQGEPVAPPTITPSTDPGNDSEWGPADGSEDQRE